MSTKLDAVVVGAGPVGLSMGAALALQGLRCRVIDSAGGPAKESRAIGIQARTLEVLEMQGIAGEFLELGHRIHGITIYGESGAPVGHLTFDLLPTRYAFLLTLAQSETERILGDHLETLGITIERERTLRSFEQSDREVCGHLTLPSGAEEEVYCDWLIGCDGAHSTVREALGLEFAGKTFDLRFLLADVHAESSLSDCEAHIFGRDQGLLAVFPLGHGRHRLIADNPPEHFGSETRPSLEEWQEVVNARARVPVRLSDPDWTAFFRVNSRMVKNLRKGRVFVLGDAAHVHSPALAQGMNTGIQDAWNLGWKMGLVQKGVAQPHLLDSFESERMQVERRVLGMTDFTQTVLTTPRRLNRALRDTLLPVATGSKAIQKKTSATVSEIAIGYRKSPIVENHRLPAGPRAGDRAPDATVLEFSKGHEINLMSIFGKDHVLLALAGPELQAQEKLQEIILMVRERYGDLVRPYLALNSQAEPIQAAIDILVDSAGQLVESYGHTPAFYLVRPDGYIAFRSHATQAHLLRAYLSKLFAFDYDRYRSRAGDRPVGRATSLRTMRTEAFDSLNADAAEAFIGCKLVDGCGESVGTLEGFWLDPSTHRVAYLGAKSGRSRGSVHVVPARDAEINENKNLIVLEYPATFIKKAPAAVPGVELPEVAKEGINAYYGQFIALHRVSSIEEIRPEDALEDSGQESPSGRRESGQYRSKLEEAEQTFFDQKGFVTDSMSEVDVSGELKRTQNEAKIRNREDREKRGDLD
jgi:3-(3-hydroxy-phenyl)propionate hydroxylase